METQKLHLAVFFFVLYAQTALCQSTSKRIYYFNPQFSPNGSSIVFESTRDGKSSIYTINPDGSNIKKITDTTFHYGQPAWSPDGRQLVYYGSSRPMQLFTNSVNGGEQKQLPTPGIDAYQPAWSSQNMIAFDYRLVGQAANDIARINADGTGITKLTTDEKYDCASPQWSPDGKKILFQRSIAIRKPWKEITKEEMKQKKQSTEVMTMNADGSDIRSLVSHLEGEVAPFWSNDGKTIYYCTKQDTTHILYRMAVDITTPEPMLTVSGVIYSVNISPNGEYATYAAERNKMSAVYVMNVREKTERKIIGD